MPAPRGTSIDTPRLKGQIRTFNSTATVRTAGTDLVDREPAHRGVVRGECGRDSNRSQPALEKARVLELAPVLLQPGRGDISNGVRMGTFLTALDTGPTDAVLYADDNVPSING